MTRYTLCRIMYHMLAPEIDRLMAGLAIFKTFDQNPLIEPLMEVLTIKTKPPVTGDSVKVLLSLGWYVDRVDEDGAVWGWQ